MKHYIIGHQKPDLDSVVAAISLAEFFKQIGDPTGTPVIADPINPETEYILNKFNQTTPPIISAKDIKQEDRILLVDHNEEDQRLPGINPDQISGIIDHHKLNLNLNQPISVTTKPWGSTNTIIYYKFTRYNLSIHPTLAALMLSAILSDTVGLKSATTTNKDKQAAKELAKLANIKSLDSLTLEIFKAKSNLDSLDAISIVKNDYKVFDFARRTFIGQIETVEQQELISKRLPELLAALKQVKQEQQVDLAFLAISDILNTNTKLLLASDEENNVAQSAFSSSINNNLIDIGPKLSRKKEIAPAIEKALDSTKK